MKTRISFVALVLGAVLGLAFLAGTAQATIVPIVQDSFNNLPANFWYPYNRTPQEKNLPGKTWQFYFADNGGWGVGHGGQNTPVQENSLNGFWWMGITATEHGNATGHMRGKSSQMAIDINSAGSYVKPRYLTISADVDNYGCSGNATDSQGIALAFFSHTFTPTPEPFHSPNVYTSAPYCTSPWKYKLGISLMNNGSLYLGYDLVGGATLVKGPVAWHSPIGAAFVANAWYNLAYDIDTWTGAISAVRLQGSDADYTPLLNWALWGPSQADADKYTRLAGSWTSCAGGPQSQGRFDNFLLTGIPEPSTLALLGMGLVGLLCYAWRKRR